MNPCPRCDALFKILLVGDSGVGTRRFLDSFTDQVDDMSIPALYHVAKTRTIEVEGKRVRLHVWPSEDGQQFYSRHKSIGPGYFRDSLPIGIVLMYDVSTADSFHIAGAANVNVAKILVGNKCDVPANERVVSKEQGQALADELGVRFVETSGKANVRVDEVFAELAKDVKKQWDESEKVLLAAKAIKDAERTQWVRQARLMLGSFVAGCVLTVMLGGHIVVATRK